MYWGNFIKIFKVIFREYKKENSYILTNFMIGIFAGIYSGLLFFCFIILSILGVNLDAFYYHNPFHYLLLFISFLGTGMIVLQAFVDNILKEINIKVLDDEQVTYRFFQIESFMILSLVGIGIMYSIKVLFFDTTGKIELHFILLYFATNIVFYHTLKDFGEEYKLKLYFKLVTIGIVVVFIIPIVLTSVGRMSVEGLKIFFTAGGSFYTFASVSLIYLTKMKKIAN